LFPLVQTVDTFKSVTSVPFLYQIVFLPGIVANLAQPYSGLNLIPGLDISDPYRFYMNNNSSYKDVGFGVTFNSIPIPIKFDNPDILYNFPVNYGNADSSFSGFEFGLPDLGFIGIDRKRVNTTDGWGTLTTPYGTFEVLRIKSQVYETDTIYIDSIGFGTTIERNYIEYKWMGNGQGLPLLQVTEEGPLVSVAYIDSIRNPITGIPETNPNQFTVSLFPNPAKNSTTVSVKGNQGGKVDLSVLNMAGIKMKEVKNLLLQSGENNFEMDLTALPKGVYLVRILLPNGVYSKKLIIE